MKFLGTFSIGFDPVGLFVDPKDSGGSFIIPLDGTLPQITVGLENDTWAETLSVLIHEAMEFALEKKNCRYEPSQDLGRDHAHYLFCLDHQQFSDACARVAVFLDQAQGRVEAAWKKGAKK